ncbi:MAG: hypothetical protein A3A51_03830 [Candidatus Levybacteria bacterium RIFCSPLOWO2_01_FULL_39_10]|nr:MAG: hypothetical protein A3A51_03830 [Candidatus Levybacteria bacterium RIFCSPLOWO2_01_FULL_39_10]
MNSIVTLNIYTDGGSRGNPGDAAYGFYIETEEKRQVAKKGERLGTTTNNVAEYTGIYESLKWVSENLSLFPNLTKVNVFMDSLLAASQLKGIYKIKNAKLREIFFEIKSLEKKIKVPITYLHIPREQNRIADRLVNIALDGKY